MKTAIVAAALCSVLPTSCFGAAYTITDLGTLATGMDAQLHESYAYGINDSGQVVGYSGTSLGLNHAFLYSGGAMNDLSTLGGQESWATGVNNASQVVGYSNVAGGNNVQHAFLYGNGLMTDLGTLGGSDSVANGINASGQVAGGAATSGGAFHAFLYSGGVMNDLGTLGAPGSSEAYGINDHGDAVGEVQFDAPRQQHAFLYSGGVMTDLASGAFPNDFYAAFATAINNSGQATGVGSNGHAFLYSAGITHDLGTLPGGSGSFGQGIDERSQVVGWASTPTSIFGIDDIHAFVWDQSHGMRDLNSLIDSSLGWALLGALGINGSGQITGVGLVQVPDPWQPGQDITTHAFLLTPTPEPSSIVLAILGLVGFIAWGMQRHRMGL